MADQALNITAGVTGLEASIARQYAAAQAKINSRPLQIRLDSSRFALGRITGDVNNFNESIKAATQRVVAFGAAAGVFTALVSGFKNFITATIEVEEALTRVGVNLDLTAEGAKRLSSEIFNIARNTGTTFEDSAKAAEELGRQGLNAEEVIVRLKDALILSRIAGQDSAESVKALTAAVNTFQKEGLTTTQIVDRLAAIDTKFAVSSKDLSDAISRVGNSAQEAGVSFNQLLGVVTAVQQTTQRGGAVIGNALKTIFTRISRPESLEQLEQFGVVVKDVNGALLPGIQILQNVATQYDNLSQSQKSLVAEQVGGVFQINILKAAIADLSRSNGIYAKTQAEVANATGVADLKNAKYNSTLKTLINSTSLSIKELFSAIGNQRVGGIFKELLEQVEGVRKFFQSSGLGEALGDSLLKGLSNVLSGPVLVGLLVGIGKTLKLVFQNIGGDLQRAIGLNGIAERREQVQARINALIAQGTAAEQAQIASATSLLERKEAILRISERIAASEARNAYASTQLTSAFISPSALGRGKVDPRLGSIKRAAEGYVPPSAIQAVASAAGGSVSSVAVVDAIGREQASISRGVGGASPVAKPVVIPNFAFGNGNVGPIVANTDEVHVKNFAKGGSDAILNPKMMKVMGVPEGAKRVGNAAEGVVPDYAKGTPVSAAAAQALKGRGITWDRKGIGSIPFQVDIDYFGFERKMLPSEFRKLVPAGASNPKTKDYILKATETGKPVAPPYLSVKWDDKSKVWSVLGHEGRSRTDAALALDASQAMPVAIKPVGLRARDITDEMRRAPLIPQDGGDPLNVTGEVPRAANGMIPNLAKGTTFDLGNLGLSGRTVTSRLSKAFDKGSFFKDFYSFYEGNLPIKNPRDKDLFNRIYSSISYGADDSKVFQKATTIYKKIKDGAPMDASHFADDLKPLGLAGGRTAALQKFLDGNTDTKKTGVYYRALSGDKNAVAIDRNIINTVVGRTMQPGEKISNDFRSYLTESISRLSKNFGVDPRDVQAAVFASRADPSPSYEKFSKNFKALDGYAEGLLPNYAGGKASLFRGVLRYDPLTPEKLAKSYRPFATSRFKSGDKHEDKIVAPATGEPIRTFEDFMEYMFSSRLGTQPGVLPFSRSLKTASSFGGFYDSKLRSLKEGESTTSAHDYGSHKALVVKKLDESQIYKTVDTLKADFNRHNSFEEFLAASQKRGGIGIDSSVLQEHFKDNVGRSKTLKEYEYEKEVSLLGSVEGARYFTNKNAAAGILPNYAGGSPFSDRLNQLRKGKNVRGSLDDLVKLFGGSMSDTPIGKAVGSERSAIRRGVGGASPTAKPVLIPNFAYGNGVVGPMVANTSEVYVKNYAGGKADAILNPKMIRSAAAGSVSPMPSAALAKTAVTPNVMKAIGIAADGYVPHMASGGPQFTREEFVKRGSFVSEKDVNTLNKLFDALSKVSKIPGGKFEQLEKEIRSFANELDNSKAAGLIKGRLLGAQNRRALSGKRAQNQSKDDPDFGVDLNEPRDPVTYRINREKNQQYADRLEKEFKTAMLPRTRTENTLQKPLTNLSTKQIFSVGGLKPGAGEDPIDRDEAINIDRKILSRRFSNRGKLGPSFDETLGSTLNLAKSTTLFNDFNARIKSLVKDGAALESAFKIASKELLAAGGSSAQLKTAILNSAAEQVKYERDLIITRAALKSQKRATTSNVSRRAALNEANELLDSGVRFDQLSKDRQTAKINQLREENAKRLYGDTGATLPQLLKDPRSSTQINNATLKDIRELSGQNPQNRFLAYKAREEEDIGFAKAITRRTSGEKLSVDEDKLIKKVIEREAAQRATEKLGPRANQLERDQFVRYTADNRLKEINEQGDAAAKSRAPLARAGRFLRRGDVGLGIAIAAPLVAGFIPEREGGTFKGAALGATSGALQGAGAGAIFGPAGLAIGATIGALIGGFSKLTKSASELAAQFEKQGAARREELDAVNQYVELQKQFNDALGSGDVESARKLSKQRDELVRSEEFSKRVNIDNRKELLAAGFNDKQLEALQDKLGDRNSDKTNAENTALLLKNATRTFESKDDVKSAANSLAFRAVNKKVDLSSFDLNPRDLADDPEKFEARQRQELERLSKALDVPFKAGAYDLVKFIRVIEQAKNANVGQAEAANKSAASLKAMEAAAFAAADTLRRSSLIDFSGQTAFAGRIDRRAIETNFRNNELSGLATTNQNIDLRTRSEIQGVQGNASVQARQLESELGESLVKILNSADISRLSKEEKNSFRSGNLDSKSLGALVEKVQPGGEALKQLQKDQVDKLARLNIQTAESIKTLEAKNEAEKKATETIRRQSAFSNAPLNGGVSGIGSLFRLNPQDRPFGNLRERKTRENSEILGFENEVKEFGGDTSDLKSLTNKAEAENNLEKYLNFARGKLRGQGFESSFTFDNGLISEKAITQAATTLSNNKDPNRAAIGKNLLTNLAAAQQNVKDAYEGQNLIRNTIADKPKPVEDLDASATSAIEAGKMLQDSIAQFAKIPTTFAVNLNSEVKVVFEGLQDLVSKDSVNEYNIAIKEQIAQLARQIYELKTGKPLPPTSSKDSKEIAPLI